MVVTPDPLATEAGAAVLRRGGSATDAAVTVAFVLAVTYPRSGNIGGGGFLLHRGHQGDALVVDFRETAPAAAHPALYLDPEGEPVPDASREGLLAVGVPGTVAGLAEAHERWGRLPWSELLAPAVRLALEGFEASPFLSESIASYREGLARGEEAARIFLLPDGKAPSAGHRLRQPELALTLARIATRGPEGFYRGPVARDIAADMAERGGIVTEADLAGYRAVVREPLRGTYRDYEIVTVPPPSSGGVALLETLNILSSIQLFDMGHNSSATVHWIVEAERRAFADRAVHLGDPDYMPLPTETLVSRAYADERRRSLEHERATPSTVVGPGDPWREILGVHHCGERRFDPCPRIRAESPETNHFSVVDAEGNAVGVTYTLNGNFGAKRVARGTGILLNNEMDDFATAPGKPNQFDLIQGEQNAVRPGRRMLSSMTPTMVEWQGELVLVAGAPGGPTIISTVLQIVLNTIDFCMDPMAAVSAPRVHHQWLPDEIRTEPGALARDVVERLQAMGHRVVETRTFGGAHVIGRDPETGEWLGAADPRRHGSARGD
jgi:gamma-glutamyltranspeptidase/glutathione hydrolase